MKSFMGMLYFSIVGETRICMMNMCTGVFCKVIFLFILTVCVCVCVCVRVRVCAHVYVYEAEREREC